MSEQEAQAKAIEAVQRLAQAVIDASGEDAHEAVHEDLATVEAVLRHVPVEGGDEAPEHDDEPCSAELWSWDYFNDQQVDPYWMRCHKVGAHDEHENSETGATWPALGGGEAERRAPVQAGWDEDGIRRSGRGTIAWSEHLEAWEGYNKRYPGQSAEKVAERGGFGPLELRQFLGHDPETFIALGGGE